MSEQQAQLKKDIVTILLGLTRSYSALQMTRGEIMGHNVRDKVTAAIRDLEPAILHLEKLSEHVKGCSHGCQSV